MFGEATTAKPWDGVDEAANGVGEATTTEPIRHKRGL
jgi:hypothetical protein